MLIFLKYVRHQWYKHIFFNWFPPAFLFSSSTAGGFPTFFCFLFSDSIQAVNSEHFFYIKFVLPPKTHKCAFFLAGRLVFFLISGLFSFTHPLGSGKSWPVYWTWNPYPPWNGGAWCWKGVTRTTWSQNSHKPRFFEVSLFLHIVDASSKHPCSNAKCPGTYPSVDDRNFQFPTVFFLGHMVVFIAMDLTILTPPWYSKRVRDNKMHIFCVDYKLYFLTYFV